SHCFLFYCSGDHPALPSFPTRRSSDLISFFGAAVLVSFPPALRAQNPGGSLLVTVQDSTGARVAGASVSLTQEKFAISRTGKADAQGEKRFESLQPGSYTVTVIRTEIGRAHV